MKLELKHLAPYLPYELKILNGKEYDIVNGIDNKTVISLFRGHLENFTTIENVKPILRPLSDLSKVINIDGDSFIPIYLLKNIRYEFESDLSFGFDPQSDGYTCHCSSQYLEFSEYYEINSKLFEWHFDVFGLIETGLAIDINTL
jgi:hypothetical protein